MSSESVNLFNHFGYELGDEILVVPIFDISYLNLIEYLKLYNGVSDFKTLWNLVYIKDYFCKCNDCSKYLDIKPDSRFKYSIFFSDFTVIFIHITDNC